MAIGDFVIAREVSAQGGRGGRLYNVAAGTSIFAGEPVQVRALGNTQGFVVEPALTNTPDASTHLYVGVAATNSTNTTSASGSITVIPIDSGITWVGNPDVAASWDTQAEYDALVGARILIKNNVSITATPTSGTYTLLAADSANNGCVVVAMDIFKIPGKVAFAFRDGTNYLS